jgi:hypothetical protein
MISLNPSSGIAEITCNKKINTGFFRSFWSSRVDRTSKAIDAIKKLNIPLQIKAETCVYIEYILADYKVNLPKIVCCLDPEKKNGLGSLLDNIDAFARRPAIARVVKFSDTVELHRFNDSEVTEQGPSLEPRKVLKPSSHYS